MNEQQGPKSTEGAKTEFDEARLQYALGQIRGEQNLAMGIAAGAAAALVGAVIWALVTTITTYQIGWMAVGVGFLVGYAIRTFGKGIDKVFGIVGAVMAALGCALGNLLAVCGMIAAQEDMGFFEVLSSLNPQNVQELMVDTFSPMDLLFYGIAIYEGYKLSIRQITEQDIAARISGQGQANTRT